MTKDSPIPQPLAPAMLRPVFDTSKFDFTSTADLPAPSGPLGQDRAIDAIELAASTGEKLMNNVKSLFNTPKSESSKE